MNEIRDLMRQMETNICNKIDQVIARVSAIETKLEQVQAHQIQVDLDIKSIKDVIGVQQMFIERLEQSRRKNNLIFSGVPESPLIVDQDEVLDDDREKIAHICQLVDPDIDESDITVERLGSKTYGKPRIIKATFTNQKHRNEILRNQKIIRNSSVDRLKYIYINKDSSFIMRKEEKRLRDHMKEAKSMNPSNDKIYIKSGKLMRNNCVIDQIHFANQLF